MEFGPGGKLAQLHILAKIVFPRFRVADHLLGGSVTQNSSGPDHIASVCHLKSFSDLVVSNQNRNPPGAEVANNLLNGIHGDGINPGEWFVQQDDAGV